MDCQDEKVQQEVSLRSVTTAQVMLWGPHRGPLALRPSLSAGWDTGKKTSSRLGWQLCFSLLESRVG